MAKKLTEAPPYHAPGWLSNNELENSRVRVEKKLYSKHPKILPIKRKTHAPLASAPPTSQRLPKARQVHLPPPATSLPLPLLPPPPSPRPSQYVLESALFPRSVLYAWSACTEAWHRHPFERRRRRARCRHRRGRLRARLRCARGRTACAPAEIKKSYVSNNLRNECWCKK